MTLEENTPSKPSLWEFLNEKGRNVDGYIAAIRSGEYDLDALNSSGLAPLHEEILYKNENLNVIQALLESGADLHIRARDNGATPLHYAVRNADVLRLILEIDVTCVDATDNKNRTALHDAAFGDHTGSVRLLLAYSSDPNARDKEGISPLYDAVEARGIDETTILVLLEHGAVRIPDRNGKFPSHPITDKIRNATQNVIAAEGKAFRRRKVVLSRATDIKLSDFPFQQYPGAGYKSVYTP